MPYSHDTIWKTVKTEGLVTSRRTIDKLSEKEIQDICSMYTSKIPTRIILNKYCDKIKSQNTIIKIVRSQNIPIRKGCIAPIINDEKFFEKIDTEEKAYLLGLLIADGSIIQPKPETRTPAWSITLHDNDRYLLERIKEMLGLGKQICHTRNESILSVTSRKMVDDLSKYGVVPRKSFITYLPQGLPQNLYRHLIRGIFDGDGCISNGICTFYGTTKLLLGIQKVLSEDIDLPHHRITIRETNGANSFGFGSKKDVEKFFHYMYDNATIFLKRKYEKFLNLNFINKDANTVVTNYNNMF